MTQPPHDEPTAETPEELRAQIEQTRHELGDTVQALADKADVKSRAQDKAHELREQGAAKAAELKGQGAAKAAELAEQVKVTASHAEEVWQAKAPAPVRDYRIALAAVGAGLVTVALLLRRRRR
ncbi:DUF3618 domain-containing protein [Streptomyces sp. NPDC087440]|uniref:DUF3618 domain-containing protein n=1 Tax=Streptomyces sp. NPDC087440 TaxID=3365790 RepID=UPI0038162B09